MSRIGKLPIYLPEKVQADIQGLNIKIIGPKGMLIKKFLGDISISIENNQILILPLNKTKEAKSMWGTARNIINSMVIGVSQGFTRELEVNGVGYRASVKGSYLNLVLGKSHNTKIEIPNIIQVEAPKQNILMLQSIDKEKLGQFIAVITKQRPPEPYKGKGIKQKGQYVQRKEGKKN